MITGVRIGDKDTLSEWGLILCSDLSIGSPQVKTKWVDIPAMDGALNMSYALTGGEPVYKTREITFNLFGRTRKFSDVISDLMAYCHGRIHKLWLPTDSSHYYSGLFEVDKISNYNKNMVKIKVTADPYRYKNEPTIREVVIGEDGNETVIFSNEMRKTAPLFTLISGNMTVEGHALQDKTLSFDDIVLHQGNNELHFAGTQGSKARVTYQEGKL